MADTLPDPCRRKYHRGQKVPPSAVYVGRPSKYGNPWVVAHVGRKTAVENYLEGLLLGELDFTIADVQRELRGKDLYCWCGPYEACHADILLRVAAGVCPKCEGAGELKHPNWGARNCPEPTVLCKICGGSGVIGDGG